MKKFKAVTAVAMTLIILACAFPVSVFAEAYRGSYYSPLPVIYIEGQGSWIYSEKYNENSELYYCGSDTVPEGYIGDKLKGLIGPLVTGLTEDNWDPWCDAAYDAFAPLFEKAALPPSATVEDGSGVAYRPSNGTNKRTAKGYEIKCYRFFYDWRLDPYDLVDELKAHVDRVKAVTGAEKVNFVTRCLGVNIALAYFEKYGTDDVDSFIAYSAGYDGFEIVGSLFSGRVQLDGDSLTRIFNYFMAGDGTPLDIGTDSQLIVDLRNMLNAACAVSGLELSTELIQKIYDSVASNITPRIALSSFGTFPSYWSMVGEEYYEDAKAFIFPTEADREEWSALIEKTDYYYEHVTKHTDEIIADAVDNGVKFFNLVKYGYQMLPVTDKYNDSQSDFLLTAENSSLGATCAPFNKTLSEDYLKKAEENGTAKYISPDKKIDASTADYADYTWFFKGMMHKDMPYNVEALFEAILNYDGYMTVFDNENYPQYMLVTGNAADIDNMRELMPLTEENAETVAESVNSTKSRLGYFFDFLKTLVNIFEKIANGLTAAISSIKNTGKTVTFPVITD